MGESHNGLNGSRTHRWPRTVNVRRPSRASDAARRRIPPRASNQNMYLLICSICIYNTMLSAVATELDNWILSQNHEARAEGAAAVSTV